MRKGRSMDIPEDFYCDRSLSSFLIHPSLSDVLTLKGTRLTLLQFLFSEAVALRESLKPQVLSFFLALKMADGALLLRRVDDTSRTDRRNNGSDGQDANLPQAALLEVVTPELQNRQSNARFYARPESRYKVIFSIFVTLCFGSKQAR